MVTWRIMVTGPGVHGIRAFGVPERLVPGSSPELDETLDSLSLLSQGLERTMSLTNESTQIAAAGLPPQQYLILLELSKAIASHRDLTALLHDLAARLHNLFDFDNFGVMLYDERGKVMRMHTLDTTGPSMLAFPTEVPVEGSMAGSG